MNKVKKKILSEDIFYIKTFFKENQVKKNNVKMSEPAVQ